MEEKKYILAIETSCDETSISLMENDQVLKCLTWSQIDYFKKWGGVIPQVAGLLHVNKLPLLLKEIKETLNFDWKKLELVAYTYKPGLIGCLKIGETVAKTINLVFNIPLLKVNHLYGHIYAANFSEKIIFPALGILVSGGHTQLIYLEKPLTFKILGETMDDAIGETIDKIGRKLDLPYPAGPSLEKLAKGGKNKYKLNIYKGKDLQFSFSGIKTSAIRLIDEIGKDKINLSDFAYSLQETLFKNIDFKVKEALKKYPAKSLIIAGGVAANQRLKEIISENQILTIVPPIKYCTDNSAMIGIFAFHYMKNKVSQKLE